MCVLRLDSAALLLIYSHVDWNLLNITTNNPTHVKLETLLKEMTAFQDEKRASEEIKTANTKKQVYHV